MSGGLYVHLKVYKGDRIYGELVMTLGKAWIRCRDCHRWHSIVIRNDGTLPSMSDEKLPAVIRLG